MPVLNLRMDFVGSAGILPRRGVCLSDDTTAVCEAASYLNPVVANQGIAINNGDFVFLEASDASHLCKATVSNLGVIQLVQLA